MTGINWADWGLTEPILMEPVKGGLINTSLRAEWADGSVRFVQRVNLEVFQDLEAIEANLLLALDHPIRNLAVLPVCRRDGRIHSTAGWRVFPWVDETKSPLQNGRELGAYWGQFNAVLNSTATGWRTVLPNFHSAHVRWNQWQAVRERTPASLLAWRATLEALAPSMLGLEAQLPSAVKHHDAKRSNVLHSKDGLKAIDLDTVQVGYLGSDFADLVRSTAALRAEDDPGENAARPEAFEAVWDGYASEYESAQKHASTVRQMPGYLTWIQALRFATDAASGNRYYRTSFEGQNWQRAQNQLSLAKSLINIR
jgi:Phosphotransferase enzyme family